MSESFFTLTSGEKAEIAPALENFLTVVFSPSSASSAVNKRGQYASALVKHLDKLPDWKSVTLDTEDEIITVSNENIVAVLAGIPSAIACNEAYKAIRSVTVKNPTEGKKRGRKESNPEAELLAALG